MAATARSTVAAPRAARAPWARFARLDLLPYLLCGPAVLMVALVTVYPALYAIGISLTDANLLRLASSQAVGLGNYLKAWDDEIFTQALWQTVRWVLVNAIGQLLVALPVALFLNTTFRARGLVRAAILIPWVVPGAVVAIIFRYVVDANYGVANDLLLRLGVISETVAWIGEPLPAFAVISTATVWSGFPFFAVTLLAALQVIPEDLYEAARIDGASAWQRFTNVTVPMLLPTILLLLLLRTIWLAHSVDLIFLMSNGGPGYNNYTVALYSFILTWNQLQLGYPSALVIMLSIVILIASVLYIRSIERSPGVDVTMIGTLSHAASRRTPWSALAAAVILFSVLAPFYWMLNIALTPEEQSFTHGVHYLPIGITLANFVGIFEAVAFGRAFLNSLVVAVSVTALAICLSIFAAYAFARFNFRGRRLLIVSLLLIYMLPGILLLVPMMVIFRTLGILNTYPALIVAESTHAVPFAVWLLTNYFASLPRELEEAAQVDGCGRIGAMVRIALPLAVPGLVAAALFVFIASWNNFLFAFMFTSGENVRTLPVLLRMFAMGESSVQWGKIMAGAVLTTLPVAAAFLFFQRYLIRGLAAGAVKG